MITRVKTIRLLAFVLFALLISWSVSSCGDDGDKVSGVAAPTLVGIEPDKAIILPFGIQVAFNDDTIFFHTNWEGDRGDTHDYFRFTNGAWQGEGGTRRDAQSTIDNDPLRGSTSKNSTIYESRMTFMLDDPNGPNAVRDFGSFGCALTCHDNSRAMPLWVNADGEVHKYLNDDHPGRLDLWHHRLGRANPIGVSDDQWVGTRIEGDGDGGSRHGDAGDGPFQTGALGDDGNPLWVFDPDTTGGLFAFKFDQLFSSPLNYCVNEAAADLGPNAPNPVCISYEDAVAKGYEPREGDTVPRRRLRQPTESRGDITTLGTTFTPSADDPLRGRWDSNLQRLLNTGNDDDTAMIAGAMYNIAFAVHTDMVTVRDHYISFPYTLSLGGDDADIRAVRIPGSGLTALPDFSDTTQFPVVDVNLFLPGITSFEFTAGENVDMIFIDPGTAAPVDQMHAGTDLILNQGISCRGCHKAATSEVFNPPQTGGFPGGSMEDLTKQRGGILGPTPLP